MSSPCNCCGEQVKKLNQQVLVMRKEIKNIRQLLDSAVRAHRKHMTSLQSAVSKIGQGGIDKSQPPPQTERTPVYLEQGNIQTVPIGYISSCFSVKNGTPRQPTVCGPSRATLRVRQSVFNNPEHSLVGLEHYSHVWVIFLFHKNGHLSYKAKVKPPRLNGQRVGVYSTRSPHRPNALGLTLAKLDRIVGDTVHLSEIDMIDGTPVLDIKPYIPDYDSPHSRVDMDVEPNEWDCDLPEVAAASSEEATNTNYQLHEDSGGPSCGRDAQSDLEVETRDHRSDPRILLSEDKSKVHILSQDAAFNSALCKTSAAAKAHIHSTLPQDLHTMLEEVKAFVTQGDALPQRSSEGNAQASDVSKPKLAESMEDSPRPCYGEEAYSTIAGWIREPPVASLEVRFTPHAERELGEFLPPHTPVSAGADSRPRFRFLRGPEEAATAIRGVLSADPRSVYRRTRCQDRLFFFTLDTADITCWFGQDFAEVLRVRPVGHALA